MLQEVAGNVTQQIRGKADAAAFTVLEQTVSKQASDIEKAMLKGLRTVSEKAASALAQKLHREVLPRPGASNLWPCD
jgi:ribosomal protein L22